MLNIWNKKNNNNLLCAIIFQAVTVPSTKTFLNQESELAILHRKRTITSGLFHFANSTKRAAVFFRTADFTTVRGILPNWSRP